MADVLTRRRRDADMPALIDIIERQQAETQYPLRWPWTGDLEHFVRRPGELEAWVADLGGRVVGHVAVESVADDELARVWAAAHRVPIAALRSISVLFADRRVAGRGIGSALLARATQRVLTDGGAPCLDVVADHVEPMTLYLRRGWREVDRIRPDWLPAWAGPLSLMILPRPGAADEPTIET